MTKHEAALLLERMVDEGKDLTPGAAEALMMGVNALNGYNVDEWCLRCKEYDRKTYSCPRFNQTIHKAVEALRNNQWIPCSKRMPKETDSMFAKFYGTDRWRPGMMRKRSDEVIVTYEYDDGERQTGSCRTNDGEWSVNKVIHQKVLAWMPFPDPYQPEPEEHTGCTSDACPIEGVEQD